VTRHAKASSAGSTPSQAGRLDFLVRAAGRRSRFGVACLSVFCLAALLFAAAPALAGTVTNERPLLFSFTGADASAGPFSEAPEGVSNIAVDNETEAVYVAASGFPESGFVSKFSPDGTAADFSATGSSSLTGFSNLLGVAVDNSGGPNQGRILISKFGDTNLQAFAPNGEHLWTLVPGSGQLQDVALDASGHPWTTSGGETVQYADAGAPPAPTGCSIAGSAEAVDLDANGNVYLRMSGGIRKYTSTGSCTFTESTLDASATNVYADQSSTSGHIFTVEGGAFSEYDAGGTELGTFGLPYVRYGKSIAYNPAKDWVYVLQGSPSNRVAVFGSPASGTVPDVTEVNAALTGAEISTAHLSGKVNPQGTSSKWHFEWKKEAQAWDEAGTSPSQSLPVDSAEHAVEFDTKALRGNTTYEVRLVGVNTATGLAGFSSAKTITTKAATEAPAVTIASVTTFGTTTATVEGTINPKGDTADWRVQLQAGCSGSFSDRPLQTLAESSETPQPVAFQLRDLLPSERYCARITATNSFGTTVSEVKEFTTEAVIPGQVVTAFAAPRTDTTARLNGRVNPQGAPVTYRFEYSKDGGATWIALPEGEDTSEARRQIVIGQELTGLNPNTTYSYRFSAEDSVGPASPQGEVKTFTTRTDEEMTLLEPRGYELVNNPDKGNQNVEAWPVSLDTPQQTSNGDRVLWSVAGGAPGSNSGTGSLFLAERSPGGWRSRTVQPPADQQVGEGGFAYALGNATPSFNRFIFITGRSSPVGAVVANTLVRLDDAQNQEVLTHDPTQSGSEIGITDDGSHVVQMSGFVSKETRQLVDVGGGAPQVLSLMPDGTESSCGLDSKSFGGGDNLAAGAQWRPGYHMIATTDASRAYFQVPPNGECGGLFGIYERNREAGETTLIDPGASGHDPEFIRATPDGRHAYFATYSKLDPSDTNQNADIYRWDEEAGESTCLTCVVPDANLDTNGEVLNYVMVSDDFSHVYFESRNQLVPGEGTPGDANLYVLSGGTLRFVANPNANRGVLRYGIASAKLSSHGSVLIFQAPASRVLTADGVARECPKVASVNFGESNACEELYRYDGRDGSLECLSCEQGAVTANSVGTQIASDGAFKMSADGSTVAFATAQALLPRDINRGTDIYEWRNGALRLLTDGVSSFPSGFAAPQVRGVDADGSNILFSVVEPGLTGFEQDGVANLYDARIGGGFVPPQPAAHCTEESCQGPLQVAPGTAQPGSATLSGPGNAKAGFKKKGRCAHKRGKAKRRCIRRHKKHSGKAGGRSR
jgi:hypothetical protein